MWMLLTICFEFMADFFHLRYCSARSIPNSHNKSLETHTSWHFVFACDFGFSSSALSTISTKWSKLYHQKEAAELPKHWNTKVHCYWELNQCWCKVFQYQFNRTIFHGIQNIIRFHSYISFHAQNFNKILMMSFSLDFNFIFLASEKRERGNIRFLNANYGVIHVFRM